MLPGYRNRTYMVTAFMPFSRQSGRFRTIGIVAPEAESAQDAAVRALLNELGNPSLAHLLEVVSVTELPTQATVYDTNGIAYTVTIILSRGDNSAA
jgi:hypothetical protein